LLNAYDNDRVEIADMRGAHRAGPARAFAEWYAEAKATNCSKYLYSLSINPDHRQGPFTREHYDDFIRRTRRRSDFPTSPAPSSFTSNTGATLPRRMSRIDTDKMKPAACPARPAKLRAVAQEYARVTTSSFRPACATTTARTASTKPRKREPRREAAGGTQRHLQKAAHASRSQAWRESSDGALLH